MRDSLNQGLIEFLKASPSPFHATRSLAQYLEAAGFQHLDERASWHTEAGGRYYVTRNDSSIIAFKLGKRSPVEGGIRLVGAHTDSPCLRVKPQPELQRQGFFQLAVEVYGGALLAPWFDRDLSLAGRVTYRRDGKVESQLIDFQDPIATIPNLAIHLNREANQGWAINPQTELPPILAQLADPQAADFLGVGAGKHGGLDVRGGQQRLQAGVAGQQVVQARAGDKVAVQADHGGSPRFLKNHPLIHPPPPP